MFKGGIVSRRSAQRWLAAVLLAGVSGLILLHPLPSRAQELTRKAKTRVAPMYPELAKRMSISGVVKVEVVVAPNGSVKSTKVVGGHPLPQEIAPEETPAVQFESESDARESQEVQASRD